MSHIKLLKMSQNKRIPIHSLPNLFQVSFGQKGNNLQNQRNLELAKSCSQSASKKLQKNARMLSTSLHVQHKAFYED